MNVHYRDYDFLSVDQIEESFRGANVRRSRVPGRLQKPAGSSVRPSHHYQETYLFVSELLLVLHFL